MRADDELDAEAKAKFRKINLTFFGKRLIFGSPMGEYDDGVRLQCLGDFNVSAHQCGVEQVYNAALGYRDTVGSIRIVQQGKVKPVLSDHQGRLIDACCAVNERARMRHAQTVKLRDGALQP